MLRPKFFATIAFLFYSWLQGYGQCVTINASATTNLCYGDTVYFTSGYDTSCFLTPLPNGCVQKLDSLSQQHQIQSGTPYMAKSVYGNFYKGYRFQFLYTAAEIGAVFDTGYITDLSWRIGVFNSSAALENFTIRMKSVPPDSNSITDWQTGMTTVYGPQVYTPKGPLFSSPWNNHVLNNPFYWDGVSNLVIEVTHYNPLTASNLVNMMSITIDSGKVLYAMANNDVYAAQTPPIPLHERPVLMMRLCASTSTPPPFDNTTTFGWHSTGGNSIQHDSAGNAFVVITDSQSYRATVFRNNIFKVSSPLAVSMRPLPQITPNPLNLCAYDTPTLSTTQTYDSYIWSTGDTSQSIAVYDSGWYKVTVTQNGCVLPGKDSVLAFTSLVPPAISPGSTSICPGQELSIYTTMTYDSYLWSNGDTLQSISVSDSGWYKVTVTQNGCIAKSTDSIYIYAVPPMNAYVIVSPGAGAGENVVAALPQVATHYWLHKTYDTINGNIYIINNLLAPQTSLFCSKDSSTSITSNYVRWILEDAHFCRDTTDWYELNNCITGINDLTQQLRFILYPNPVSDIVFIDIAETLKGNIKLAVTNIQGRELIQHTFAENETTLRLNTSILTAGSYLVRITAGDKTGQSLFVK